jgi:hypothetical protein
MITVQSKVGIYEMNGEKVNTSDDVNLNVSSHWNSDKLVTLTVGVTTIAVKASDLIAAINNATNTSRF